MKRFHIYSGLILASASGLLATLAFPKFEIDGLAWIALVPLLVAIRNRRAGESFRLGFIAGLVHFMTLLYWVVPTMQNYGGLPLFLSIPILFLFASVMSLYIAVFSVTASRTCTHPWICVPVLPALWVATEYFRTHLFTGFPWGLLGYSQHTRLPLIQIADITGVYGVSFIIVIVNVSILLAYLAMSRKRWAGVPVSGTLAAVAVATAAIVLTMSWSYGKWRLVALDELSAGAPTVRVAVVQGNIEQSMKWDRAYQLHTVEKYLSLSTKAKTDRPDLIVWPETATPFYFPDQAPLSNLVRSGIRTIGTDVLFGGPSIIRTGNRFSFFNSAFLVSGSGRTLAKYDKVHLVPFGEYVPFKEYLPFLGKIVAQVGDFSHGTMGNTLHWGPQAIGVQICYEIIFPNLSRRMVERGATLLVNITNDAWYGFSSAPYQHFSMVVFRAVENRRSLVRAANTGISGFVDPGGRVLSATPLFKDAVRTQTLPTMTVETVYTRYGDGFAWLCLLTVVLAIGAGRLRRGRPQKRSDAPR